MLRLLLICALTLVALATPILDTKLDKHWEMWKDHHSKKYEDKHSELKRRLIWEENFKAINLHNLEHSLGMHTFTQEMNVYGDLRSEEFVQRNGFRQGLKKTLLGYKNEFYQATAFQADLPDTVDWRTKGYVTPVKDQGQCGSCWSFSTTGALEGQYFKKTGTLVSFSEQQLVDCSTSFGNMGCNGGLMDQAFDYIKQYGEEKEADYPYTAEDDSCVYDASKEVSKDTGHVDVESGSESDLQNAVATVGPISVAIDASHSSFQFYSSGVYNEPSCSSQQLDHGVLAVGYGTEDGQDYWLVKNSWNTSWGDKGYIKMSRNQNNQCGIATSASYPIM
ncbi:LOW QUALITY PROTEIN: digestive cysteine proteinase 2-like [Amphiura filiformis]|uniref:LOW QUALITY PROTEIN: digestive cysteine proteinase 2-like n=1 Tax=Amphiura filiformis TaxID=82378 RepID=UPI003B222570